MVYNVHACICFNPRPVFPEYSMRHKPCGLPHASGGYWFIFASTAALYKP